jgi:hypothetical protein
MIALLVATAVLIAPAAYPDLHAIVRFAHISAVIE